jgi:colanic acid/amylovoran biosynthesis glycosyltransferase
MIKKDSFPPLTYMRILYFSRDYGSYTTTFIRNQVEHIAAKHKCMYLCQQSFLKGPPPDFLKIVPFKDNVVRKILWKLGLTAYFRLSAYSKQVTQIIKDFNPDIIHCHFASEALMLLDNINHRKYRILIHFHGYDAADALNKAAFGYKLKYLLNQPNIIPISCNNYFARRLSDLLHIPASKFIILRYGIDTAIFNRKDNTVSENKKTFLQISSLSPKKGHQYTLKAFAMFLQDTHQKNCQLIIAGDGSERDKLEYIARKLGIQNNVQFTGVVTSLEAAALLQKADVFVHHSVTAPNGDIEGIPNAIIEAMSMKLPVISTYHSGIPELVTDKVNGYLVKEKDINNYALKMQAALEMGFLEINREKITEFYEVNKQNEKLEKIYNQFS